MRLADRSVRQSAAAEQERQEKHTGEETQEGFGCFHHRYPAFFGSFLRVVLAGPALVFFLGPDFTPASARLRRASGLAMAVPKRVAFSASDKPLSRNAPVSVGVFPVGSFWVAIGVYGWILLLQPMVT